MIETIKRVAVIAVLTTGAALHAQSGAMNELKVKTVDDTMAFFHYAPGKAPIISGHRGGNAKGLTENTIPAFENVLRVTPAMFEMDPRFTKDGMLVIMHDGTLERTTQGHGKVNAMTLAEVQATPMKDFENSPTTQRAPTLEDAIVWSQGKSIINLDIKDSTPEAKVALVQKHNAFANVIFTVHDAKQAKVYYDLDKRSMFAALLYTEQDYKAYEATGIPWSNISLAYVGSKSKPENKGLYDMLHKNGVMVMVACSPSYDKLPTAAERAAAYRQIIKDGADIIESDLPLEVAAALKGMPGARSKLWSMSR